MMSMMKAPRVKDWLLQYLVIKSLLVQILLLLSRN